MKYPKEIVKKKRGKKKRKTCSYCLVFFQTHSQTFIFGLRITNNTGASGAYCVKNTGKCSTIVEALVGLYWENVS